MVHGFMLTHMGGQTPLPGDVEWPCAVKLSTPPLHKGELQCIQSDLA